MTAVRLPVELEQKLEFHAKGKHTTKSEIIKEALESYFGMAENDSDAYEIGCVYFGLYGSGDGNLSTEYKLKLKEKIHAKRSSH
jgi:hypothetical protein